MDALLANLASLNAQVEDGHAALALANGQLVQLSDELAAAQGGAPAGRARGRLRALP